MCRCMERFSKTTARAMTNSTYRAVEYNSFLVGLTLAHMNWAATSKHSTALSTCFPCFLLQRWFVIAGNLQPRCLSGTLSVKGSISSIFLPWKGRRDGQGPRQEVSQWRDLFAVCTPQQNLADSLFQRCNCIEMVLAVALTLSDTNNRKDYFFLSQTKEVFVNYREYWDRVAVLWVPPRCNGWSSIRLHCATVLSALVCFCCTVVWSGVQSEATFCECGRYMK